MNILFTVAANFKTQLFLSFEVLFINRITRLVN